MLVVQEHWGLTELPFSDRPGEDNFYPAPVHLEALARLQYVVENERPVGLLCGDGGSGKTSVFAALVSRLAPSVKYVFASGCNPHWLSALAQQVGRPTLSPDPSLAWRELSGGLYEQQCLARQLVVAIDDAHQLTTPDDRWLNTLAATARAQRIRLTILLSAQPNIAEHLRPWSERSELRVVLDPWTPEDVGQFIEHAMTRAGGAPHFVADEVAYRIWNWSGGQPRGVVQLVRRALLAGAGSGTDRLTSDLLDAAQQGLAFD